MTAHSLGRFTTDFSTQLARMARPGGRGQQAAAPEERVRLSVTPDSAAGAGASGTVGVQHVRVEIKSTKGEAGRGIQYAYG